MPDHQHRARLFAYLGLMATFETGLAILARRRQDAPRQRMALGDLLLFGVATHKVANLVAQDRVTRVLREPFVEERQSGAERPASGALRGALGQLVTCPFCLSPWVALAFTTAHTLAPGVARVVGEIFAVATVSDLLHHQNAFLKARVARAQGE